MTIKKKVAFVSVVSQVPSSDQLHQRPMSVESESDREGVRVVAGAAGVRVRVESNVQGRPCLLCQYHFVCITLFARSVHLFALTSC
jgi:hypothetical protein